MSDLDGPIFESWRSYQQFRDAVLGRSRYIWDASVRSFLETVKVTVAERRALTIGTGTIYYRAQRGIETVLHYDAGGAVIGLDELGFAPERMKPKIGRAIEGRANSRGMPVLYVASTEQTAISEVRPWIGSKVSLAQFATTRELRAVDLTLGFGQQSHDLFVLARHFGTEPDPAARRAAVWTDIDNAFSEPVTASDDQADYVPTQILAELFRSMGFDAIVYRSQFGDDGKNIAIFDIGAAEFVSCAPYEVTAIDVAFNEFGTRR